MTRLVHLSDLHFGKHSPDMEPLLLKAIEVADPDLVVVSGDFTQRARSSQFAAARDFLDRLSAPWLGVPGNHDTPLDEIWVRMFAPWRRYRHAIDADLEPRWENQDTVVVGVNTVNRFSWQRGRLSQRRIVRTCARFRDTGERCHVIALHHPLQHGPEVDKRLMKGAGVALAEFAECGAQIVLSGHLHNTIVAPFRAAPGLLFVQAGTGLSTRQRGEPNSFNILDIKDGTVTVMTLASEGREFDEVARNTFRDEEGVWRRVGQAEPIDSTVRLPFV